MVSGGCIAATLLHIDVLYVDSQFGWKLWKSNPGSERLIVLSNPLSVFGDMEEKKAIELFNAYNYSASIGLFGSLINEVRDPRAFEVKKLLEVAYDAWDRFDYTTAHRYHSHTVKRIGQFGVEIPHFEKMYAQLSILKKLVQNGNKPFFERIQDDGYVKHLLIDVFCNAQRRAVQGRFDDAIIRFYRVLELIAQHKLAKHGIDTAEVVVEDQSVLADYERLTKDFFDARRELPSKVGLIDSLLLLFVLKDEMLPKIECLKTIKNQIRVRNNLLIEHGGLLGTKRNSESFGQFVMTYMLKIVNDVDRRMEEHRFIKL